MGRYVFNEKKITSVPMAGAVLLFLISRAENHQPTVGVSSETGGPACRICDFFSENDLALKWRIQRANVQISHRLPIG